MNIIQVQDRLKGLPEDALVNYVKNPTGSVPIYLALGEINRRKEMEAKFNANKEEKANIKDQLISGLGGMDPRQMDPRQMDPRQMTPEMLASSGVAALPTKTMKFKEGGIIGYTKNKFGKIGPIYEDGSHGYYFQGLVSLGSAAMMLDKARKFGKPLYDKFGKPIVTKGLDYLKNLKKKRDTKKFNQRRKNKFEDKNNKKTTTKKDSTTKKDNTTKKDSEVDDTKLGGGFGSGKIDALGKKIVKETLMLPYKNPIVVPGLAFYFSDELKALYTKYFDKDGNQIADIPDSEADKIKDLLAKEKIKTPEPVTDKETPFVTPQIDTNYDQTPEEFGDAQAEYLRSKIGTDPNLAKVATRLEELEERAGDTREGALNRALIMGGLTMAGTESPNFLSGLSEGAMGGVKTYGDELDKAEGIEDKAFELDLAINQAKRKEDFAIANYGAKSAQAETARRDTRELENAKLEMQRFMTDTSVKVAETTSGMYGLGEKINAQIRKEIASNQSYINSERLLTGLIAALEANPGDETIMKKIQQTQAVMLGIEQRIKARYPTYGGGSQSSSSTTISNIPQETLDLITKQYSGNKTTTNPKTTTNTKTDDSFDVEGLLDSVQTIGGNLYDDAADLGGDLYDKGDKFITDLLK